MTKRKWIITGATLGILVLFGLILLTTFNFQNEHENISEDLTDRSGRRCIVCKYGKCPSEFGS